MKKFDQWYFPDGETHLPDWMQNKNQRIRGRLTYQYNKYQVAEPYIKQHRLAVDIGSHIGLWAWHFCHDFEHVVCFEPCPAHIECWYKNMADTDNVTLFTNALGEQDGCIELESRTAGSSGDTQVNPKSKKGNIPMMRLDSFDLEDIDFIKIDCEGFEEFILRGGLATLMRCKPCIIVEQKGIMSTRYGLKQLGAVKYLESLGAKLRTVVSGDYILSWD